MEPQPPPHLYQYAPPPPQDPNPAPNPQQQYYYPNPNPDPNPQQLYYYPNPNPHPEAAAALVPYAPHGGFKVDAAASRGESAGADAAPCYYYQGYGWDPLQYHGVDPKSHGQVLSIASNGLNPAAPSHAVSSQWGAKLNYKIRAMKTTKVAQSVHCGVCKIECNTQEVLNIHKQGKKHKNNLQKLQESITPKPLRAQMATNGAGKKGTKILEGGSGPIEVRQRSYCEVCKIYCDTRADFNIHQQGKKHKKNFQKLQHPTTPKPQEGLVTTKGEEKEAKILEAAEPSEAAQQAYCAVCNIFCNSDKLLNIHNVGKKHKRSLVKLQESITPEPDKAQSTANNPENKEASVSQQENAACIEQRKRREVMEDVLETKKRKMIGGGTEPGEVKVCTICNVVNSRTVYNFHIAGLKHAAMVKKQQKAAVVEGEKHVESEGVVDPVLTPNC